MKIYEAWEELKQWLVQERDAENDESAYYTYHSVLGEMEWLELKHE